MQISVNDSNSPARKSRPLITGLTHRDIRAVRLAYDLQYLTIEQATTCLFHNWNVAQRRLAKLEDCNLLVSFPMPQGDRGHPTKVYYLNRKSWRIIEPILGHTLDLANIPVAAPQNALVAQHHIELNNVLCAFISAAAIRGIVFEYIPEYRASHGHGRTNRVLDQKIWDPIKPGRLVKYRRDAVCCLGTNHGKALFEIEYDRGNEVLQGSARRKTTIARKLAVFLESLKHRHFTRYSGTEFFAHPFQVSRLLIITTAIARLNNIAELCLALNTHGLVYVTTMEQVSPSTVLGPIWVQPVDGTMAPQSLIGNK